MLGQMTLFPPATNEKLRNRVQVVPVELWQVRNIIEQHHYLKRTRTGRQINYSVLIDGVVDGVITYAYPMLSVPIEGVPSDELLEFARMYLAANIPHSASCAIGKTLKRVQRDWMAKYPDAKLPRLVVSWSDKTRHLGTIYKAANFQHSGISKAALHGNSATSKRGFRQSHDDYNHDKDRWMYWLR
jgi:hypothetical protein